MRKLIFAISVLFIASSFIACNNNNTNEEICDSVADTVIVDSCVLDTID